MKRLTDVFKPAAAAAAVLTLAVASACSSDDDPQGGGNGGGNGGNEDDYVVLTVATPTATISPRSNPDGADNFFFGLCSCEITTVNNNYLPALQDNYLIFLDLYGRADDAEVPLIPDGTYRMSDDRSDHTLRGIYSSVTMLSGDLDNPIARYEISDGTVEVKSKGDDYYAITVDYTLLSGEHVKGKFDGHIPFTVGAAQKEPLPTIDEDAEIAFTGVTATWRGESKYQKGVETVAFQIYDKEPVDDRHVDGYCLTFELYMPALDPTAPFVASGRYEVSIDPLEFTTPVGDVLDLREGGYGIATIGSTARQVIPASGGNEEIVRYGAIVSGVVDVARTDETYTVKVDVVTAEGSRLTGEWTGGFKLGNYVQIEPSKDPVSPLDGDLDYDTSAFKSCRAVYYEPEDGGEVASILIEVMDDPIMCSKGFRFWLNVPVSEGRRIVPGTYPASSDFSPMTYEKGYRDVTQEGTWWEGSYVYVTYDWLGYIESGAPAVSGDLDIADNGGDSYTLSYAIKDDRGNTVSTTFTGTFKLS